MSDNPSGKKNPYLQFSRAFYVINGIELLERGAYYSTSAVLTVFMTKAMGLSASAAGGILALLLFLLYAVPLVAAAVSTKFGYKASLVVAFVLLTAGYGAFVAANSVLLVFIAVALVGFGAGTFKPIAAALVGETTTEEQRNFAYILYYGAINVGAFLFPLTVGIIGATHPATDYVFQARTAFIAAVSLAAVNLVLTLTIFRNLRAPQKAATVGRSLKSLAGIFKDPKFMVLLFIYIGFWFMYATSLTFITVYMVDYVAVPTWFNAAIQQAVNPLIIIVMAPVVGIFTKRANSLALMSIGIGLYVLGFVVVGATTASAPFLVGIAIFSFGELLTHPSFLSYVSKIAPADKVAVYMSYAFLPIAIGLPLGSSVGGALYQAYGTTGHPRVFWAILAAVGLVSIAALLLYNRAIAGAPAKEAAPGPERKRRGGVPIGIAAAVVALLLVPALVAAAVVSPATPVNGAPAPIEPAGLTALSTVKLADDAQKLACGKEYTKTVTLPANATGEAVFSVTFKTPAPSSAAMRTTPDSYELHVTPAGGTMAMGPASSTSPAEVKVPAKGGDYVVTVKLATCGGESPAAPVPIPGGVGGSTRTEGAFTLAGSYQARG